MARQWTQADKDKLAAMLRASKTYGECAAVFGVTRNVIVGLVLRARAAGKPGKACLRGHLLTPENIYARPDGWRECRLCRAEAKRKALVKKPACAPAQATERRAASAEKPPPPRRDAQDCGPGIAIALGVWVDMRLTYTDEFIDQRGVRFCEMRYRVMLGPAEKEAAW